MDEDDWDAAADILEDMPASMVTLVILLIVALCFLGWYAISSNACMDVSKQAHKPYYDYSFSQGCRVGDKPFE